MTKDELKNRLESAEKQMEGLENEIRNLRTMLEIVEEVEIPKLPFFKADEEYWFVDSELETEWGRTSTIREANDFNQFHSEEYAQLFADKCREIAMLLHCKWHVDRDYVPNWDDGLKKYSLYYDNYKCLYEPSVWVSDECGDVFFSSMESAEKACAWMNAHAKRGDSNA